MRQSRLSGSVEGVMGNHDSYSDMHSHKLKTRSVLWWLLRSSNLLVYGRSAKAGRFHCSRANKTDAVLRT